MTYRHKIHFYLMNQSHPIMIQTLCSRFIPYHRYRLWIFDKSAKFFIPSMLPLKQEMFCHYCFSQVNLDDYASSLKSFGAVSLTCFPTLRLSTTVSI